MSDNRLHIILARATNQWMIDHDKTLEDAIGEVHVFTERLRIHFEITSTHFIREYVAKIQEKDAEGLDP